MELIKIMTACFILVIKQLLHVFSFWFEEEVISLYKYYKHLPKTDERKKNDAGK